MSLYGRRNFNTGIKLIMSQPTGKDGGTLFVKWAARARGHRLRRHNNI